MKIYPYETAISMLLENIRAEKDRRTFENILLEHLESKERLDYREIVAGKRLPELTYDVIAKKIFNPDTHPERLNFLLQNIAKDNTIEVTGSAANEIEIQTTNSKRIIMDIPAMLTDGRRSDTEIQVSAQNFILKRGELYGAEMLTLQYSAKENQKKSEVAVENTKGVLLVVLMRHSSKLFTEFDSDRYIHRFTTIRADSGLTYEPFVSTIYVELDKCLEQFNEGQDGENNRFLQMLLAAIADINNPKLDPGQFKLLEDIIKDVRVVAANKEVQGMLLAEKYAAADLNAIKSYERDAGKAEGKAEGISEGIRISQDSIFRNMYAKYGPEITADVFNFSPEKTKATAKRLGL